jgi:putative ABC transport system permease protein
MQIIGVAKNYHHQSLAKTFTPIMMIMYNRIGWIPLKYVSVKLNTADISGSVGKIEEVWNRFFPESTFDFYFVDEFYNRQYNQDKRFGSIFGLFSILAVFVACLDLWALSMFTGILRSKEIGVRRVNGASVTSMVNMLNLDMLKWVFSGIIIALPAS